MIKQITRAYQRIYSDTGQAKTYVEWIDTKGRRGRTEGEGNLKPRSHMLALVVRAAREGVRLEQEVW